MFIALLLLSGVGTILILIGIIIKFYSSSRQLLIASINFVLTLALLNIFFVDSMVCIVFLMIIIYDIHLRITQINKNLMNLFTRKSNPYLKRFYLTIEKYMSDHNHLCTKAKKLSNFWMNLYLVMVGTLFPLTLILWHQVLFERIDLILRILYVFSTFVCYTALFGIQYFLASFSAKMHKMFKKLFRFQLVLKSTTTGLGFKIKLLQYFERLSSKRKIGFSIGSVTVITFPLFSGVRLHVFIISLF